MKSSTDAPAPPKIDEEHDNESQDSYKSTSDSDSDGVDISAFIATRFVQCSNIILSVSL